MAPGTISSVHDLRRATAAGSAGFSLFEVLVALLVLGIGLVGVAALQLRALQDSSQAVWRSQLIHLTAGLAEAMQANPRGAAAGAYEAAANDAALCQARSPGKCLVSRVNGSPERVTERCDPQELAQFDVWQLRCGDNLGNRSSHQRSGEHSVLIDCRDVDPKDQNLCSPGSTLTVVVPWGDTEQLNHGLVFTVIP